MRWMICAWSVLASAHADSRNLEVPGYHARLQVPARFLTQTAYHMTAWANPDHKSFNDESVLRRFLTDKPLHSWLGLDPDGVTWKRYQVPGLPLVAVVDRRGRIAAITLPEYLGEGAIRKVLNGEPVSLPVPPPYHIDPIKNILDRIVESRIIILVTSLL